MMDNYWAIVLVLTYFLALTLFFIKHPKQKLPPGPKPWPIIGNLNLLGSLPHQSLHHLSKKYGELMLMKFGKFSVLVASSPKMAEQFLKIHDAVFASRPLLSAGKYISYNYSDLSWAPYGPYWRQVRKIYLSEMLSTKKLESFAHIRVSEGLSLLSCLHGLSGKPIILRDYLSRSSLLIVCKMLFDKRYFDESKDKKAVVKLDELQEMFDEWFVLGGVSNIGDWIPWIKFFDLQGYIKRMKDLGKRIDNFLSFMIDDHELAKEKGYDAPKDFVDSLLELAKEPHLEVKLTKDCIKALVQNLIVGGTDTISITLDWAIREIMKQPHIIKKAKEELDRVIGRNRWVNEEDSSNLPYIDAIIMESMRLHPLTTLLAPHCSIEDCNVVGYNISKGTIVIFNTWSMGRDPNLWDAPNDFLPKRFVGKPISDVTGSNFSLLPFGSGRRRCPGYNLGLKVVRTTLANLLHGFNLKLIDGRKLEDICLEEEYGLTTHPKYPPLVVMEPTLPHYLY